MRHDILLLLVAALAPAQIVSVGAKAGVPLTRALRYGDGVDNMLDTGRWTIGPTIEFRLLHGFSVEADALYRGYRRQSGFAFPELTADGVTYPPLFYSDQSDTKVWDFPLLLKYRIGSRAYRPFVVAGHTWSHASSDVTSYMSCLGSASACATSIPSQYYRAFSQSSHSNTSGGPTVGAGVEFRRSWAKIAPEIRYTHTSNPTANGVTLLVGLTF